MFIGNKSTNECFDWFDSSNIDKGKRDEKAIFCIQPKILHLILIV